MLVGLNADNPMLHDVYRLDLETGAFDKIETNPGYAGLAHRLRPRRPGRCGDDARWRRGRPSPRPCRPATTRPGSRSRADDLVTTGVYGFNRDGSAAFLLSSVGANAVAAAAGRPGHRRRDRARAEDPEYDVAFVLSDPETLEPQSVVFLAEREQWVHLDPAARHRGRRAADPAAGRDRHLPLRANRPALAGRPTHRPTGRSATTCTTGTTGRADLPVRTQARTRRVRPRGDGAVLVRRPRRARRSTAT